MVSLKELSKKVQKPEYKTKGTWMARHVIRDLAVPFTWLLLHTPVTANSVTVFSIIVVVMAAALFSLGTQLAFLAGAILLQLWYLLDHIDGQIARYKNQQSITGVFLDYISHYFPHLLIFPFMSLGIYRNTGNILYVYAGILTGAWLSLLNLFFACKYTSFFWGAVHHNCYRLKTAFYEPKAPGTQGKIRRQTFAWLYKLCEVHIIMNLILFIAVISYIYPQSKALDTRLFIIFYAIVSACIFILKLSYYVTSRKIDKDFFDTFEK